VHPQIANPDFVDDKEVYVRAVGAIGVDIWQVKSGTVFDSILVTDSVAEAEAALPAFEKLAAGEAAAKKAVDDAAAKKAAEAAEAAKAAAAADEDDEEEEEAPKKDEL
jgi:calreticulin